MFKFTFLYLQLRACQAADLLKISVATSGGVSILQRRYNRKWCSVVLYAKEFNYCDFGMQAPSILLSLVVHDRLSQSYSYLFTCGIDRHPRKGTRVRILKLTDWPLPENGRGPLGENTMYVLRIMQTSHIFQHSIWFLGIRSWKFFTLFRGTNFWRWLVMCFLLYPLWVYGIRVLHIIWWCHHLFTTWSQSLVQYNIVVTIIA